MYALLELLAEFAAGLLPVWIQRRVPERHQIWVSLGCSLLLTILLVGAFMLFLRES